MSVNDIEQRIAKELATGEVTLWLGPQWACPVGDHARILSQTNWEGIWDESRDPGLAELFHREWRERPFGRSFVEVTDLLTDVLDRDFLYARICPLFYLNGRAPEPDKLTRNRRQRARIDKIEQLERVGAVTLLVAGVSSPTDLVQLLTGDLEGIWERLERVVVFGANPAQEWRDAANELSEAERIEFYPGDLVTLLERVALSQRRFYAEGEERLRVGRSGATLPLHDLLTTDPPIDQYFHLITDRDLAAAHPNEKPDELLLDLLRAQHPNWRAFRNRLHWTRPAVEACAERSVTILHDLAATSQARVSCLDWEAESGSGLTTALRVVAHRAAESGFPTLIARANGQPPDFEVLRTFLLNLEKSLTGKAMAPLPALVLLDAAECDHDPRNLIKEWPRRLRNESRRVLLVRGTRNRRELGTPTELLANHQPPRLAADLKENELTSLVDRWARPVYGKLFPAGLDSKLEAIRSWASPDEGARVPLLVALYEILQEGLRPSVNIGRHLLDRLSRAWERLPDARGTPAAPAGVPVRLVDGTTATLRLGQATADARWGLNNLVEALTALAALGRFSEPLPRRLLQHLVALPAQTIHSLLDLLEDCGLATVDLIKRRGRTDASVGRLAPPSRYHEQETVELLHGRHYGPMLLEALVQANGPLAEAQDASPLCRDLLGAYFAVRDTGAPLLTLFRPLIARLPGSGRDALGFAEHVSMHYMRRHVEDDDNGSQDTKLRPSVILDAHGWVPVGLQEQSGPLLHSRALARKDLPWELKDRPIQDHRRDYQAAIEDMNLALELEAARPGGEDPGNLKTTLGLIHREWARRELAHPIGDELVWREQSRLTESVLREACALRRSTYPAFALARWQVDRLQRHLGQKSPGADARRAWFPPLGAEEVAGLLEEIIVLLSDQPAPYYRDRWNRLCAEAYGLLGDDEIRLVIHQLKQKRDEMGYALDALRELGQVGVPREPTTEETEVGRIRRALALVEQAAAEGFEPSGLGNLLRYALFSALPERVRDHPGYSPEYRARFQLLRRLAAGPGSVYLQDPIWRYDLAMLAFQVGEITEGLKHFRELRKGRRYVQVPSTRTRNWVASPDDDRALVAGMRIVTVNHREDRGTGRMVGERWRLVEEIPFRVSVFTARRVYRPEAFQPGRTIDCSFHLRPSGPYAVPTIGGDPPAEKGGAE